MNPTYTFDEAWHMIAMLDLDGLKILLTVIAEEKNKYTHSELKSLHLYWNTRYMIQQVRAK